MVATMESHDPHLHEWTAPLRLSWYEGAWNCCRRRPSPPYMSPPRPRQKQCGYWMRVPSLEKRSLTNSGMGWRPPVPHARPLCRFGLTSAPKWSFQGGWSQASARHGEPPRSDSMSLSCLYPGCLIPVGELDCNGIQCLGNLSDGDAELLRRSRCRAEPTYVQFIETFTWSLSSFFEVILCHRDSLHPIEPRYYRWLGFCRRALVVLPETNDYRRPTWSCQQSSQLHEINFRITSTALNWRSTKSLQDLRARFQDLSHPRRLVRIRALICDK